MMREVPSMEQQAMQEAGQILPSLKEFRHEQTEKLRTLLDRIDTVFIQEALLNRIRLQPTDFTDAWRAGAGHKNFLLNNQLWREVRSHGYGLINEFKAAAQDAFGGAGAEFPAVGQQPISGLRADFYPVRQLCLIYPEEVREPGYDYSVLTGFYQDLLRQIPTDIEVVLMVKSRQIMHRLQSACLHPRIRYVVNSELKGIWLRDYAGFSVGNHLLKPTYKPKSYWGDFAVAQTISDKMKLLHSVLELDMELLDLVWDGGNLVTNGTYGFISTDMVEQNKKQYPQREQLEELIQQKLGIRPVWVELPKADKLAHTDGYLTFINPATALVSTFAEAWAQKHPEDQRCVDVLAGQLQDRGIEVIRIQEQPQDVASSSPVDSAVGLYVNLLQLNGTWLVPTYGLEGEQELLAHLKRLNPDGSIIEVNCTKLAELGGVLHCISFCN